jgi:cytochrome bd-type quinol oxidase subunit 2
MNNTGEMSQQRRLTWNRAALYIIAVMILCIVGGIFLASRRIYLRPPWFQYTVLFYVSLWLPVVVTVVLCIWKRPAGRWVILIPLLVFLGLGFCAYLTLLGPAMYSDITCDKPQPIGLAINQYCRCQWKGDSESGAVECKLAGVSFLPFVHLIEVR